MIAAVSSTLAARRFSKISAPICNLDNIFLVGYIILSKLLKNAQQGTTVHYCCKQQRQNQDDIATYLLCGWLDGMRSTQGIYFSFLTGKKQDKLFNTLAPELHA